MKVRRVQKQLSFWEKAGLPEIVKGLLFTFRVMFRRKFTRQYPEQRYDAPPATKGMPLLVQDEDGTPRCVACSLCEFVCPPRAITIYGTETDRFIEREPEEFKIDMLRCILCGLCEEVCPKEAIVMSDRLELAEYQRKDLVFDKKRLLTPVGELQGRIKFTKSKFDKWHSKPGAQPATAPAAAPAVSGAQSADKAPGISPTTGAATATAPKPGEKS